MSKIKFKIAAWSEAAGRPSNEDSFLISKNLAEGQWSFETNKAIELGRFGALMVVCDGMGGMNAGEIASALAVEAIKDCFSPARLTEEIVASPESIRRFIAEAIIEADRRIKQEAKADAEKAGMGSTIVLAWLLDKEVHIGWCGDSRAYRFNSSTGIKRLSRDHSYVQSLVDSGKLSPVLARQHPNSHIITRSLGDSGKKAKPDVISAPFYRGDTLLLCSDGLCGVLDDDVMEAIIRKNGNDMCACRDALLAASEQAGWTDNVTLALCCIVSGGVKPASRSLTSETVKQLDNRIMNKRFKWFKWFWFSKCLLICLFMALAIPSTTHAQPSNEWTVSLGVGNQSLGYSLEQKSVKSGVGGGVGLGYTRLFNRSVGLSVGLEANLYGNSIYINHLFEEQMIQTPPGLSGNFVLQTDCREIAEKQHAVFVQLPVMLQLQAPISKKTFFYFATGVKAGLTVSQTWSQTIETLTTTGFSEYTGQTYSDMPNHGFETKTGSDASGNLTLDHPVMLAFEGGFKWKTSDKTNIYIGMYFDYGLTDICKPEHKHLLEYNPSPSVYLSRNSLLQTDLLTFSQNVKPFAIGVKIRIAFGSSVKGKKGKKAFPGPLLGYN
jgi:protein phosphatase